MTDPDRLRLNENSEEDVQACAFCGGFTPKIGSATAEFLQVYPELSKDGQVIKVSENFILMADVAPITNDHLLLITKEHIPSMARTEDNNRAEIEFFLDETTKRMQNFYPEKEIVVFEHGVGTINGKKVQCGSCGRTDHAHLHILPVSRHNSPIAKVISEQVSTNFGLVSQELSSFSIADLKDVVSGFPYLFIWSSTSEKSFCLVQTSPTVNIPSQIMRKLLLKQDRNSNVEEQLVWDWRDFVIFYPKMEQKMIAETMKKWLNK